MDNNEIAKIRIDPVLDKIRQFLQIDGGDVEFVRYEKGVVELRLLGRCAVCPLCLMTLRAGIEPFILELDTAFKRVELAK